MLNTRIDAYFREQNNFSKANNNDWSRRGQNLVVVLFEASTKFNLEADFDTRQRVATIFEEKFLISRPKKGWRITARPFSRTKCELFNYLQSNVSFLSSGWGLACLLSFFCLKLCVLSLLSRQPS